MPQQQLSLLHDEIAQPYAIPRLRLLPICEQPAFRVARDSDACNLAELLAVTPALHRAQ
jgi:DNA repair protein RadC